VNRRRKPRILIAHQGCVPIYRKALYQRLGEISDIEYVVLHGEPPRNTDLMPAPKPYDFPNIEIANIDWFVFNKNLVYQPILGQVLMGRFDGFVLGDEVRFVSSVLIALFAALTRRPIVLWGFGYHPDVVTPEGALGRLLTRVASKMKRVMYRAIDGYLAYTQSAADQMIANGMPREKIGVLHNTIDVEAQRELKRVVLERESIEESRDFFGFDGDFPVLLYFGRFLQSKRIDLLIEYVRRAKSRGQKVGLLIFGAGSWKHELGREAAGLDSVRFFEHDDLSLTRALRVASAVVIPGFVGLAVTHAFAHGVPMITRAGQPHSPEIDYLKHGENGLVLPEEKDAFFEGLDSYLRDSKLQQRLRMGAAATVEHLTMDNMVRAFDNLVRRSLTQRGLLPA
jgi:glycosyltransferase involved in cell wall biosynthesis